MFVQLGKIKHSVLARRLLWTIGIVFVYMLGSYTPIGTLPLYTDSGAESPLKTTLNQLAIVSGGNFSMQNLFSLGLSPWMTSMILWRFFSLFKIIKTATKKQTHFYQMTLMLLVAVIQAYGFSNVSDYYDIPVLGLQSKLLLRMSSFVIMIAGSYVLTWLANLNAQKGVGGPTVIIIANMTLSFLVNAVELVSKNRFTSGEWILIVLGIAAGASLLIWITVRVYRAEYRIPIRRIMVVSSFAKETYIPLKLTPAGGMPFMYAMTLVTIPALLFSSLLTIFPDNGVLQFLAMNAGISTLPGILFYIALLFVLAIGFAYFNLDPEELSESLKKSGDYIEGVRPGKATQDYINRYLWKLAVIGAVYTSLVGGLPMLAVWSQQGEIGIALLINNIYIMTTLMLVIVEQVDVLQTWKQYSDII